MKDGPWRILGALTVILPLGLACHDGTGPESIAPATYPTTFHSLSESDLEARLRDFRTRNPRFCSHLDRFGFTVFDRRCLRWIAIDPEEIPELLEQARATLVANADFAGIDDVDQLAVDQFFAVAGFLDAYFAEQRVEGRLVLDTRIRTVSDSLGVTEIRGHHFPNITFPPGETLPVSRAKDAVLGRSLLWYDFAGNAQTLVISPEHVEEPERSVIVPFLRDEDTLELREAWVVPVCDRGMCWDFFVDKVNGDSLRVHQLFVS